MAPLVLYVQRGDHYTASKEIEKHECKTLAKNILTWIIWWDFPILKTEVAILYLLDKEIQLD